MKPMIKTAEKENRRSFSVSSLSQGATVTVETKLYFKAIDGKWYPIATFSDSQRTADQETGEIDLMKQDPQVARVMDMAKQFGLSDPKLLDQAMRGGVATKKALQHTSSELNKYVDRYSYEIDNPPVEKGK